MSCIPTSSIIQSTSKVKVKKKLSKNGKSRARRMPTYPWEILVTWKCLSTLQTTA
jgi:hypothetical protein